MLFGKKKTKKLKHPFNSSVEAINIQSTLGRQQTSIETAKDELYIEPEKFNPLQYINIEEGEFFGMCRVEEQLQPIYVPEEAINHKLYCGITRSGKGIMAGIKCVETLQYSGRGLIYLDTKEEDFIPQVILEEMRRQKREDDFIVVTWPNDFGYSGIGENDSIIQLWEKMCVALNFQRSDNPGVEHYRSNQRMTLLKLLNSCLNQYFNSDWYDIMEFVRCLRHDYLKYEKLQEEEQKAKRNIELVRRLKERYFKQKLLDDLDLTPKNIEALEVIYISIFELLLSANVYNGVDLGEALYNGKVIYIKTDMENQSSLQFLKLLFKDISQKVRMRRADCHVFADEISFYATDEMAGSLSTMAGFGVRYTLMLQDLAQLPSAFIKNSILTNCSVKLFYKITDLETLKYVGTLGGDEYISVASLHGASQEDVRRDVEPLVNTTRVRAMWYMQHAILIAEYFNTAAFVTTFYIEVEHKFKWGAYKRKQPEIKRKVYKLQEISDGDIQHNTPPKSGATGTDQEQVEEPKLSDKQMNKTVDF